MSPWIAFYLGGALTTTVAMGLIVSDVHPLEFSDLPGVFTFGLIWPLMLTIGVCGFLLNFVPKIRIRVYMANDGSAAFGEHEVKE